MTQPNGPTLTYFDVSEDPDDLKRLPRSSRCHHPGHLQEESQHDNKLFHIQRHVSLDVRYLDFYLKCVKKNKIKKSATAVV